MKRGGTQDFQVKNSSSLSFKGLIIWVILFGIRVESPSWFLRTMKFEVMNFRRKTGDQELLRKANKQWANENKIKKETKIQQMMSENRRIRSRNSKFAQ